MPYKDPEVARLRKQQWRLANIDRIRAERKERYAQDAEACKEKSRAWHRDNRELAKDSATAWRVRNLALARERAHVRHLANLERDRARSKAWDHANRDRVRELGKAWRIKNRERDRHLHQAWAARHPERHRVLSQRSKQKRRASERGAFVEYVDRDVVFRRDKGKCSLCNRKVNPKSKWHVDHVVPLSKGGTHCYANVRLAHWRCNVSKGAALPKGQLTLFQVVV